jgi:tetratricopeptide (TPR) repeat protein
MKFPIIVFATALLLGGCSSKQSKTTSSMPEGRIESDWMSGSKMDTYLQNFDSNRNGTNYWLDAVEGRWNEGEAQYRLRHSQVPDGWGYLWYWWFNQNEVSFKKRLEDMKRQGITLVYRQEFKLPNGETRFQGVWQELYGTDGNKRKVFELPSSELEEMLHELEYGWQSAQHYHEKYAGKLDRSALALSLLGKRYAHEGCDDKAIITLQQAVQLEANRTTQKALAEQYLKMGDTHAWLQHMTAILNQTENHMDAILTHQEIADQLILSSEWDEAWPHISPSTESNSWLPLMKASWYYGLTGHPDEGLNCLEKMANGLGSDDLYNYLFSFNLDPTPPLHKTLNQTYKWQVKGDPVSQSKAACISLINQDIDDAVALLTKALKSSNDPWYGVFGAIICDQQQWHRQRDQLLQEAVDRYSKLDNPSNNRLGLRQFLDLYIKANTEGISPELRRQFREYSTSYRDEGFNVDAHAFAGEVLRLKGETKLATEIFGEVVSPYFQQRVCSQSIFSTTCM